MSQDYHRTPRKPSPTAVVAQALTVVQELEAARWSEEEWDAGLVNTVLAAQRAASESSQTQTPR